MNTCPEVCASALAAFALASTAFLLTACLWETRTKCPCPTAEKCSHRKVKKK